ncbi:Sugar transporter STL1 [Lasiodiplodia hormozganensis]|uniref:Sugar transporter STL1 n=1 Tax=Lasiodiplodia hormozganensis TaxID=869390 RepID=A0AA39YDM9_9PEZI|nr:Sugar transporter STL1 [Lasiodiplodia hormozganensis]
MVLTGKALDWAITLCSGAGFLLFGYDQGVMSGLLTGTAFTQVFPSIDTQNGGSSSLQGTVVAIYVAVWHAELMQAHDRGKGLAIEFILNIFGVALAYWVDYAFSFVDNESQFRLSTIPVVWVLDRLGRRKLMLFAVIGQSCCMAILAGTVSDGSKPAGIVAAIMLFMFNFFFAIGLLAIPWLLPAEYAPLAIRTKAASLATASNVIMHLPESMRLAADTAALSGHMGAEKDNVAVLEDVSAKAEPQ